MSLFTPRNVLYLSILAGLSTLVLKTYAYWITDSISLLSDAAESIINLIAAIIAFIAIRLSERPADDTHTYGHEKIEYFSSGFEGALILFAALSIGLLGVHRLISPQPLQTIEIGMVISFVASMINAAVAVILLIVGKKYQSIVLEADGQHLLTDVYTTCGVLIGLFFAKVGGVEWVDPILAIGVSLIILNTSLQLIWKSFKGLMDHALPEKELALIREIIALNLEPEMTFHALRSRQAGSKKFVDFHLLLPGILSIKVGHQLMEKIEHAIKLQVKDCQVQIHAEPIEDPTSWEDNALTHFEKKSPNS
ncbi:MAG: cation transporter [Planctomycetes bacterium]|nr:cation transporter [Planctomycetota bacterium]NBY02445.1 cation transporter [Planctomycetota bacterium]